MSTHQRIEVADAIRGIAVAMILMLHAIEHFNFYNQPTPDSPCLQLIDRMVWDSLWFLIGGKAYAIFALLFGLSFHIMLTHARSRGDDFRLRFMWRMVLLFLFGNLNAAFFCGEVLVLYSIIGMTLPLVCHLRTRTVLMLAAVCLLQPVEWLKMGLALLLPELSGMLDFPYYDHWQQAMTTLAEGNLLQTMASNLWHGQIFSLAWAWGAGRFFQTAGLFMLGMVAGRINAFSLSPHNTRLWACILAGSLMAYFPLTGIGNLLPSFVGSMDAAALEASSIGFLANDAFRTSLLAVVGSLQKCSFMLVIVCSLLFAFYYTPLRHAMRRLMPYGRMSLTNYVVQSIIGSFLFYHWGLHLVWCDTWSELLCLGVLVLQVLFCTWWMRHHKRGPLESIWHRLTYL